MELDWTYFFSLFSMGAFYRASAMVIALGSLSWLLGLVLGFGLAQAEGSRHLWLRWPAKAYVWFFRSVPLLVLLVFVYNLPQIFPATGVVLGIPFLAGLTGMVMTEAAYMAEIHRGGLLSVARGQREAGHALGLGWFATQTRIVLPQAFRIALPAIINTFIESIKDTTLISIIGLIDVLGGARGAIADGAWLGFYREAYLVVGGAFFVFCFILSLHSRRLEREFSSEKH